MGNYLIPLVLASTLLLNGCATQERLTRAERVLKARWTSIGGLLAIASGRAPNYDPHPSEQPLIEPTTRNPEAIARAYETTRSETLTRVE